MPTFVFKCEGCGGKKPFFIHEGEIPESERNKPIQKHCPTCRMMTNWVFALPEQRSGRERRTGLERRLTE